MKISENKKNKFIVIFTLLIYLVYAMRGGFYTSGSFLSKGAVVMAILTGFLFLVNYYKELTKRAIFKYHICLVILMLAYWTFSEKTVYGSVGEAIGLRGTWDFLKCFLYANTALYSFYVLRKYKGLTDRWFLIWWTLLLVATAISMHHNRLEILASKEYDAIGTQMAVGYFFATLMPVSFLISNKAKRIIFVGVLLTLALLSVKRGAILLGLILFVITVYYTYINGNGRLRFKGIIIGCLLLLLFAWGIYEYVSADEFMMRRLEKTMEGDSSNREDMYGDLWSIFLSSSFFELLFGRGMIKTVTLIGNYAHNDWFESLIDFGLFFTVIYILFLLEIFRHFRNNESERRIMWLMILFSFIFKSIVSMGIYSLEFYNVFALMGFLLGSENNNCQPKDNK